MVDSISNETTIKRLRTIPAFVDFAREKMDSDPDFWRREADFGSGIMGAAAQAIVAIGGVQP